MAGDEEAGVSLGPSIRGRGCSHKDWASRREAVRKFDARLVQEDRQGFLDALRIPPVNPRARDERSSSLTVTGFATAARGLLLAFPVEPGLFAGMSWVGVAVMLVGGR